MRIASAAVALLALGPSVSAAQAQTSVEAPFISAGVTGFQEPVRPQTPALPGANNANPVYAPGLTAGQLLERALPYLDASDAVYGLKPLNGQKPIDWKTFFPQGLSKMPADVRKTIDDSGFRAAFYMVGKQPVLAIAGSDSLLKVLWNKDSQRDWSTNLFEHLEPGWKARYFGSNTKFEDSQSVQNQLGSVIAAQIKKQYPNLIITGHSLGGEIAAYAGARNKIPAVTFNPSAPHFSASERPDYSQVLNFVIKGEGASLSGKHIGNTISFDPSLSNSPATKAVLAADEVARPLNSKILSGGIKAGQLGYLHLTPRFREISAVLAKDPSGGFTSLRTGNDGFAEYAVGKNAPVVTPTLQQVTQQPAPQAAPPLTAPASAPAAKVGGPVPNATGPKPNAAQGSPPPAAVAAPRPDETSGPKRVKTTTETVAPRLNAPSAPSKSAPSQIATLSAPPPPRAPAATPVVTPVPTHAGITGFYPQQTRPVSAVYRPGGISLRKAAAEKMALNVDLEGLHYANGQIILSGRPSAGMAIDAALFLTAMRTACEATDPFFSLDPDNGQAWLDQGRASVKLMWDRTHGDFTWTPNLPANRGRNATIPDGLTMRTISVRRDMSRAWGQVERNYPDLKTRLVFRPDWLRETRFGEILYKADVLLKELTSGVSIVNPASPLRAAKVDGYIAPHMRSVVGGVFDVNRESEFRGHRLWFDLMPQGAAQADIAPAPMPVLNASRNPTLYSQLSRRGYIAGGSFAPVQKAAVFHDSNVIDISQVYPKMFVRRYDHASGRDITGTDAYLNLLSSDVNARTEKYTAAYKELRDLTEIFRAYVASVKIARQDGEVCTAVRAMPLFDAEKTAMPLPMFHPSEMFINVVRYVSRQGNKRLLSLNTGTSISGGIALRGREFYDASAVTMETKVIADLRRELAAPLPIAAAPQPVWKGESGRQYIVLNVVDRVVATDAPTGLAGVLRPAPVAAVDLPSADHTEAAFTSRRNLRFASEGYKSYAGGTLAQCRQLCRTEKECVAIGFQRSTNSCQLYNMLELTQEDTTSDIGVKQESAR